MAGKDDNLARVVSQRTLPGGDQAARIMLPGYSQTERLIDGVIHALGVVVSVIAVAVLLHMVIPTGDALLIMAATIYSIGLIAMFGLSAAYNLIAGPKWKEAIRRYDHAAIYIMIAGTYTPFALISIGGPAGYGLLAPVWLVAIIGLLLKLLWLRRFEHASLVLYLALGWIGLVAAGSIIAALPVSALVLLCMGGIFYTIGVVFHLWTTLLYQNAIWHTFVLAAAGCHYVAVLESIIPK